MHLFIRVLRLHCTVVVQHGTACSSRQTSSSSLSLSLSLFAGYLSFSRNFVCCGRESAVLWVTSGAFILSPAYRTIWWLRVALHMFRYCRRKHYQQSLSLPPPPLLLLSQTYMRFGSVYYTTITQRFCCAMILLMHAWDGLYKLCCPYDVLVWADLSDDSMNILYDSVSLPLLFLPPPLTFIPML